MHVFYDIERREKEKDSTYILRIIAENFDAFLTLSHLPLAITGYAILGVAKMQITQPVTAEGDGHTDIGRCVEAMSPR